MNFKDEIRNAWLRPNNGLIQLIIINIGIFVLMALLAVISTFTNIDLLSPVYRQFSISSDLNEFIRHPWTLVTYAFSHSLNDYFHIIFNMLVLYWFGRLFTEYLGSQKLINLYVLGAIAGGLTFLLAANVIPADRVAIGGTMVGASAAIYAISVATAILLPEHTFHLIFLGPVKIKYIVAVYIFFSVLGSIGGNAGGNLAHLGGALMGYIYVKQLNAGNEMGRWVFLTMEWFQGLFKKKSKIKVTHRNSAPSSRTRKRTSQASSDKSDVSQEEIDKILDKIADRGYDSLSREEKQKLFNASKK